MTHPSMAAHDVQGLNALLARARSDRNSALPETARQFEALFLQTMLKTMRASQRILDEDSPFRSQSQDTFQEMLDNQFSMEISNGKGIGLAQMMVKQLSGQDNSTKATGIQPLSQTEPVQQSGSEPTLAEHVINFVETLKPYAEQAAAVLGIDEKMLIAQAALETGWGMFTAKDAQGNSTNNLFNIKASEMDKNAVKIKTTEFLADKPIKMNQYFKKYGSLEESFKDYVNLITGSQRYHAALDHRGNSELFIQGLQKAGYATDPGYADKILKIYRNPNLQAAVEHVARIMQQGDES